MKLVILDGKIENPGDLGWGPLEALGELTVYDDTEETDAAVIRRIGDAEILLTNKTPITRAVLEACPSVRYIAVLATGYNVVDVAAARERGIPVSNVPGYGTMAVAQFAIGLLLELCHHVTDHSAAVHAGKWTECGAWCFWDYPILSLAGKTMGIIGFGSIGRQVGRIARALGMEVLATGSRPCPEGEAIGTYVPLDELLARADVVSIHCPLTPETQGLINRETIARMKDGAMLVNNARGAVLVEQDVADALNAGKLYGAAVDVVSEEPIRPENPLLSARNCLITPHISWASAECREKILTETAENVAAFLRGERRNCVNL